MSGFTSGAACIIGLNQMKSAFGFINDVPQAGQHNFEYNYQVMQWWHEHFNDKWDLSQVTEKSSSQKQQDGRLLRNPYAVKVSSISARNRTFRITLNTYHPSLYCISLTDMLWSVYTSVHRFSIKETN
jgi:hypothetical protein